MKDAKILKDEICRLVGPLNITKNEATLILRTYLSYSNTYHKQPESETEMHTQLLLDLNLLKPSISFFIEGLRKINKLEFKDQLTGDTITLKLDKLSEDQIRKIINHYFSRKDISLPKDASNFQSPSSLPFFFIVIFQSHIKGCFPHFLI